MAFEDNVSIQKFINEVREDVVKAIGRLDKALSETRNTVAEKKFKRFKTLLQSALNEEAGIAKAQKKPLISDACRFCNMSLGEGMVLYDNAGNGVCGACKKPAT